LPVSQYLEADRQLIFKEWTGWSIFAAKQKQTHMKRTMSLPIIGFIFTLLAAYGAVKADPHFTVTVQGKGKPMILIHGLYCSGAVWKETVERYASQYECHIITLAGFGGNQPQVGDNFLETVKNDIIQYTKDKKLNKPVIMGHSMGAFLSLWAASSAPGVFSKVIAIDGVPFMPALQMPGATSESSKGMAANIRNMMQNQTPEQVRQNQSLYLPTMITSEERVKQVTEIAVTCDSKTQAQVMYEMYTVDLRETVAAIDCPVMLMGAWVAYKMYGVTGDSARKAYADQVKKIKDCQIEMTDTGKHFIFYDEPAWFYERTDNFLKK
jgi:pimeloyl-ACP methyl ester carboxylesterase